MSSKSSRRRTASADVESADVEPNPVDEPTVTDPQAVIQEIIETKAEVEIVDEPSTEETHDLASLAAASQRLFGVSSEVVFGAAHHASLFVQERVTVPQVRSAIESYLRLPV